MLNTLNLRNTIPSTYEKLSIHENWPTSFNEYFSFSVKIVYEFNVFYLRLTKIKNIRTHIKMKYDFVTYDFKHNFILVLLQNMNWFQEKFVQNTTYMGKYCNAVEMLIAVHARMCIILMTSGNVGHLMLSIA